MVTKFWIDIPKSLWIILLSASWFLMEKENKYVAPEAQVLSAQVEKGVYSSTEGPSGGIDW